MGESTPMLHQTIASFIEEFAPTSLAEAYDNVGFLVGDGRAVCTGVMLGFDCTPTLVEQAIAHGCNLIVTHHPLLFRGMKNVGTSAFPDGVVRQLIRHDIAHYAVHTNVDNVLRGVNDSFVQTFDLQGAKPLVCKEVLLKKLVFFAPLEGVDILKEKLYIAGAGSLGNYTCCSFSVEGIGSFLPNEKARPFLGSVGEIHYEKEVRVEMIFPFWLERLVVETLKTHHPYEEVAYDIIPLHNTVREWGSGVVGDLPHPMQAQDFLATLKCAYHTPVLRHTPPQGKPFRRVAFCGGSGASFIAAARRQGAEAYVTGDLKYHDFLDARYAAMMLVDVGHYESEISIVELLYQKISSKFASFAVFTEEKHTSPVAYYL